jgi:hypothetical protein
MRRVIARGTPPDQIAASISTMVSRLDPAQSWQISIEAFKPKRSDQQNAFLWGVVYPSILEGGGETLRGWTTTDLHEYFLIEAFGSEVIEGFGRKRHKPIRRSSKLTKQEFSDYLALIEAKCAELGIHIPEPSYEQA